MRILISTYSPGASIKAVDQTLARIRRARAQRLSESQYVLEDTFYTFIGDPDIVSAIIIKAEKK